MPSTLDPCRKAQTLRAFLDGPVLTDADLDGPEASQAATDTVAHLLFGCTSCREHLEASLAQPEVPGRVAAALRTLGPTCPGFGRLWYVDRPVDAEPPPELREVPEEGSPGESASKAAYLKGVTRYCRSLAGRDMPNAERLAEARRVLSHVNASCRADLTPEEWRELYLQATLAVCEAAFQAGDTAAEARYRDELTSLWREGTHPDIDQTLLALHVLRPWREGELEVATLRLEEMFDEDDSGGRLGWRRCLFHLLTGAPLEVLGELETMKPAESEEAGRRLAALGALTRASLLALPALAGLRKAG